MTPLTLKSYQQTALDALGAFARTARIKSPALAFGELAGRPYNADAFGPQVPCVCLRIPTGGGKTVLAAHAVPLLAREWQGSDAPVAVWLVPSSLSDLEIVGCKSAAAVHFWLRRSSRTPSFCPIAGLWGCKSGKNCPRWGRFWRNLRFSLSTLQVRQAASDAIRQQTLKALQTLGHAYRAALTDACCGEGLQMCALEDVAQIAPPDWGRHAVVVVATIQSFRVEDAGQRNVAGNDIDTNPPVAPVPQALIATNFEAIAGTPDLLAVPCVQQQAIAGAAQLVLAGIPQSQRRAFLAAVVNHQMHACGLPLVVLVVLAQARFQLARCIALHVGDLRDQAGALWARARAGKAVFGWLTRQQDGKSLAQQLDMVLA